MDLKKKNVLVVGSGISGIAASQLLDKIGANVTLFDENEKAEVEKIKERLGKTNAVAVLLGTLPEEAAKQFNLVVLSPGVPIDIPMVQQLRAYSIPIWGEIELAYQLSKGRIAAITGTNGKTTTTALVGQIMKEYFSSVFVVGNIGIPYTGIALDTKETSVVVAEISSFQLETVQDFKPTVSAILNITPDHLNRHHSMENYIAAKLEIAAKQTKQEICVLNYEDMVLRELGRQISAKVFYFSSATELEEGIYLHANGDIILAENNEKTVVCNKKDLKLLGMHNYENVMAGIAIAVHMGVPMEYIRKAVVSFVAVEHRIEYVAEKNGVKYYNDSKGTNPDAAIKGIEAMVAPTLLIGGGYDKGSDYEEWIEAFDGKVKQLVLLGQTKDKIAETAERCGFHNIIKVDTLEEAIETCKQNAEPGDAVLLSPACASWGMFKNFEERGERFKAYVRKM